MTPTKSRLEIFDLAKAVAIILVVIGHYSPTEAPEWYKLIKPIIYSFHMPLFMLTSGYIYAYTNKKKEFHYLDFIKKKFERLMLPYYITSVIITLIKMATEKNMFVEHPVSVHSFYEMFYYPSAGIFLWFVFALFLIFLIVPIFKTPQQHLFLLGFSIVLYYTPIQLPSILCLPQVKINLLYFVLGMIGYDYNTKVEFLKRIPFYIYGICFFALFTLSEHTNHLRLPIAIMGILFMLTLCQTISKQEGSIKRSLLKVATASYIIYLFHTTAQGFVKSIAHKYILQDNLLYDTITENILFAVVAIVIIITGVVVPMIMQFYIITKNHWLSYLFGLANLKKQKT